MMTVALLCAVFQTFTIPSPWVATEVRNLQDRATVAITRPMKSGEVVTVPVGCAAIDTPATPVLRWGTPGDSIPIPNRFCQYGDSCLLVH